MQIVSRAPQLETFRMASSRVGMDGGIALANSMMAGADVTTVFSAQRSANSRCVPVKLKWVMYMAQRANWGPYVLLSICVVGVTVYLTHHLPMCQPTSCVCSGLVHAGRCLQRLDLSDNPMTSKVAESLAAMLRDQVHLRALNLNDTSLEDTGVSTIAQALAGAGNFTPTVPKPVHATLLSNYE